MIEREMIQQLRQEFNQRLDNLAKDATQRSGRIYDKIDGIAKDFNKTYLEITKKFGNHETRITAEEKKSGKKTRTKREITTFIVGIISAVVIYLAIWGVKQITG